MKLAELLNERKTVNEEIKMVKQRLYLSAKMQEGDTVYFPYKGRYYQGGNAG